MFEEGFAGPPWAQIIAVAIGGMIGSVLRFLSSHYLAMWFGTTFPWGTLFVNVAGSALLGFVAALALGKPGGIDPVVRLLLTAGLAGGFTTFSTFAYETIYLFQKGDVQLAIANLAGNMVLGVFACILGMILARLFT